MFKLFRRFNLKEILLLILMLAIVLAHVFIEMDHIERTGDLIEVLQYSQGKSALIKACIKLLYCVIGIAFASLVSSILSSYLGSKLAFKLRKELFEKVNTLSQEEINKFSIPSLITRSTNDIKQIQMTFQNTARDIVMAPTMAIMAITKIINKSAALSSVTGGALAFMLVGIVVVIGLMIPSFIKFQKLTDRLNLVSRENITGIRVVRAYNAEEYQKDKFEGANEDLTHTAKFIDRTFAFMQPTMMFIMDALTLVIYWVGAFLMNKGHLSYATLAVFSQYSMHVILSFMFISMIAIMIPRGIVSAKRINEVLDTVSKIKDGTIKDSKKLGTVEYRNVSFSYPDAEVKVVENVSFKAKKGDTVAFIGSTGSGKSTLINLLPRFYDATEGEILLDGVNVKDYTLEALNDKIGYIPQKGFLFSGTIASNVRYGKEDANEKEIWKALDIAQATNFVKSFEDGLDHPISQGGTNVSGGQRQRLCIARAIVKKPEILVFDDSFSALDYKTDRLLRDCLKETTKDTTKLIVAQRIGTIMDADLIIVLDQGKVVGQGTHKELLETCDVYKEIALSQLSKEELAYGKE